MVRRGSTVRVRQRASNKDLQIGSFIAEALYEAEATGQSGDRFWGQVCQLCPFPRRLHRPPAVTRDEGGPEYDGAGESAEHCPTDERLDVIVTAIVGAYPGIELLRPYEGDCQLVRSEAQLLVECIARKAACAEHQPEAYNAPSTVELDTKG